MRKMALGDLLSDHVDALVAGDKLAQFDSQTWLWNHYLIDMEPVLSLLRLAQMIKRVLVPVKPHGTFRLELGQKLVKGDSLVWIEDDSRSHVVWLNAAVIGSLLSLVGLALFLLRRFKVLPRESQPMRTAV